jgi:hypothetical protein
MKRKEGRRGEEEKKGQGSKEGIGKGKEKKNRKFS